jgi:predicted CXXCH cytochrome family protein
MSLRAKRSNPALSLRAGSGEAISMERASKSDDTKDGGIKMKVKRYTLCAIIGIVLFFIALQAYAGVKTTKHNLSATSPGTIKAVSETGICVFCHTPHGASVPGDAPIWNHTLSTANYTVPSNAQPEWVTMLTTVGQPDKGAKLCLCCHDGTVAIGMLVNTPGPGSSGQAIQMLEVTPEGYMRTTAGGYIGTDISGHHPISIAVNDTLKNDKLAQCSLGVVAFYVEYPSGTVKLWPTNNTYKGNPGVLINGKPSGVQCRSCHDPHNDPIGSFLVIDKMLVCSACHKLCP